MCIRRVEVGRRPDGLQKPRAPVGRHVMPNLWAPLQAVQLLQLGPVRRETYCEQSGNSGSDRIANGELFQ